MGKIAVAEFIEDRKILEISKELGIEYGQGYYFSKPLPIGEIYNRYFAESQV